MQYRKLAILLFLVSISFQVNADNKEQILIHADTMKLDINTGSSVYRGNVSFTQGKIEIHGDTVTVTSKNGSINEVKIEGDPARYIDTSVSNRILAESTHMNYRVEDNKLDMQGKARLEQGDRLVQSEKILYDTKKQIILAGQSPSDTSTSDPSHRVNIILTPKKERTP
jgi:lipopolysaccharide export system protein LptA